MTCASCSKGYDLFCANITPKHYSLMDQERKNAWTCQECFSKKPKIDNSNTPVRFTLTNHPSDCDDDTTLRDEENVTTRTKKQRTVSDSGASYVTEDKLRSIIKQEITSIIKQLVSENLSNISQQISGFHESLSFFNKQYDELVKTVNERNEAINCLISRNETLSTQVSNLTVRIEQMEQNMRSSNIEINGIPEHKSENLFKTIEQLGTIVANPVGDSDILHVTRIAKLNRDSDRPRSVIVKLRSQRRRDELLAAVTKFNKTNRNDKLNSEHLGIGGHRVPVFVSEHLTPANKHLHAAARKKAKESGAKFVWVRDGRVFVRKDEQSHAIYIKNEHSLKLIV